MDITSDFYLINKYYEQRSNINIPTKVYGSYIVYVRMTFNGVMSHKAVVTWTPNIRVYITQRSDFELCTREIYRGVLGIPKVNSVLFLAGFLHNPRWLDKNYTRFNRCVMEKKLL